MFVAHLARQLLEALLDAEDHGLQLTGQPLHVLAQVLRHLVRRHRRVQRAWRDELYHAVSTGFFCKTFVRL